MEQLPTLLIAALLAAGCDDDVNPDPARVAKFDLTRNVLPYPTDLHFQGSTDGTLNIAPVSTPIQVETNSLDGFSTTAVIRERFGSPLKPASLTARSVRVVEARIDNATKHITALGRELVQGVDAAHADYSVGLSNDHDDNGSTLEIRPLKPLSPSTGKEGVGYLVVLTKDIRTGLGTAVQADRDFARLKLARSSCGRILDSKTRNACEAVDNQLHFAQQLGVSPDRVALTFSFSTEAPLDTLRALANPKITAAQAIEVVNTGLTTQALNPALPGHATLYKGTMQVAYYGARPSTANPTAPLTASWHGQSSSALTRFNPIPETTETLSIPLLITVPNTAAMPANGWPVVIFQHGLTRNRLDAIAIADTFADAGYVVASIDLALHGVTDSSNPFFDAPNERTFNLDLVNNATSTAGPDGEIDPTGTHFINLASLRTTRDNLRQSAVDLLTLVRTLPNLNLGTHAAQDIDPTRIHFIGHSLGGIVGGVLLGTASRTEISTGELANAGGEIVRTIFDSPAFGAQLKRILAAQGIQDGTRAFAEYVRDAQGIIDAGDPLNYIAAATQRPLLLLQVSGDQVVLNNATQRLVDTANLPRICDVGDNLSSQGFVSFVAGAHGSLLDPSSNLAVTVEMQTESVVFARSLGRMVRITDPSVVQPDCAMKR